MKKIRFLCKDQTSNYKIDFNLVFDMKKIFMWSQKDKFLKKKLLFAKIHFYKKILKVFFKQINLAAKLSMAFNRLRTEAETHSKKSNSHELY